jgi:hypothetical protein
VRAGFAALLSLQIAVFLGEMRSQPSLDTARFLSIDPQDHNQTRFHRSFYKYYTFLPDSTPTLSPPLEREGRRKFLEASEP